MLMLGLDNFKAVECAIHPGRLSRKYNYDKNRVERYFTCCNSTEPRIMKTGCTTLAAHNFEKVSDLARNWAFDYSPPAVRGLPKHRVVVLDCEMGGTTFDRSELVLLCAVDFFTAEVLVNSLVRPSLPIKDWRTQYSGVSEAWMREAVNSGDFIDGWQNARAALFAFIDKNTILMGHSIHNDLDQLRLIHDRVIDTSLLIPRLKGHKHSVKALNTELTGKSVQRGGTYGHNCLEDTLAARELVIWCFQNPSAFVTRRKQSLLERTKTAAETEQRREAAVAELQQLRKESEELTKLKMDTEQRIYEAEEIEARHLEAKPNQEGEVAGEGDELDADDRLSQLTEHQSELLQALIETGITPDDAMEFWGRQLATVDREGI